MKKVQLVASPQVQKAGFPEVVVDFHDLSGMLGSIIGSLGTIQNRIRDDEKAAAIAADAIESASRVKLKLMESLRTMPTLEAMTKSGAMADRHYNHRPLPNDNGPKDLFFAAIEMSRMPMTVTDPNQPDNPIVFANQAFINTTGYSADEILGKNCRFLQGKNTDKETILAVRNAIDTRTDLATEVMNYRKDGTVFWNALFISPIFSEDGRLLYFFGSQLDVTRRREAEAALRKSQKMEAVGQLTGGIAHDFNNLLQVILGNLQLARTTNDFEKSDHYLDMVEQAATKARTLTQQLLAFSRKQPLEAKTASLNRIVVELRGMLSRTLGENITIETALDKKAKNIQIDTVQLEMALLNILVNSRDAMPNGGSVKVSTSNRLIEAESKDARELVPGSYVELSISDNGAGMSADVLAYATEPFFTTKDVGKGTGLGLAQVYGFVKQSNGHLFIDSKVGEGTTIKMLFPTVASTSDDIVENKPKRIQKPNGKGEKILIVEDNKEVQSLAKSVLESSGYIVITADNAAQALDKVVDDGLVLLFSDVIMPGSVNGVTLAKEVRKTHPDISILLTTGFADDVHGHTNSIEFETIYKPYMPDDLTKKIRSILNRRGDHRA